MKPANNKSLLHFLFDQMNKLDEKRITADEAKAMALLAREAYNCMSYEISRTMTIKELEGSNLKIREIEAFSFDTNKDDNSNTKHIPQSDNKEVKCTAEFESINDDVHKRMISKMFKTSKRLKPSEFFEKMKDVYQDYLDIHISRDTYKGALEKFYENGWVLNTGKSKTDPHTQLVSMID